MISFLVCGLRPVLAALSDVEKVPNPTNATLSPFAKAFVTFSVNEFKAFLAASLACFLFLLAMVSFFGFWVKADFISGPWSNEEASPLTCFVRELAFFLSDWVINVELFSLNFWVPIVAPVF